MTTYILGVLIAFGVLQWVLSIRLARYRVRIEKKMRAKYWRDVE